MIFIKQSKQRLFGPAFLALCTVFFLVSGGFAAADPALPLFAVPSGETRSMGAGAYGGLGSPGDPLPAMAKLRTGILPNGLRYYILENSFPADRAYLTLAVNAGSVLEKDDERGLAHFVEHMAFSGTRRFPGSELVNYLRSLGMRFGPEVNAYTSHDATVYGIETPVERGPGGIKRIPEKALAILDDWTQAVSFESAAVEKERAIIMEEYRTRLGPEERTRRELLPVIFRGSRYADRLPIGLPEIIQTVTAEKLGEFYRTWYRPDNMAVILSGDFDGAALEKELASHFSAPAAASPLDRPYYELPDPQNNSVLVKTVTDPEMPYAIAYFYFKRSPRPLGRTLEQYRESITDYLVQFMTGFRGDEAASGDGNPFMYAASGNIRYGKTSRYYIMAAQIKSGRIEDTLRAMFTEKEKLVRYGFTQAELDRAKTALLSSLEQMTAEKDRRESEQYIEELTSDFLDESFALDVEWEFEAVQRLLPGIDLAAVNGALLSYYADDDLSVLITAPEAETVPGEEAILAMIRESRSAVIAPPEEKTELARLVNDVPEAGKIVSAITDESGAEIWELANGMKLILMETANKNNELAVWALARGGTITAASLGAGYTPENDSGNVPESYPYRGPDFSAQLAGEIQSASGLGPFSRAELLDFLSGKQLALSFWTSAHTRGFRGYSSLKDTETLFQMLHVYFTQLRIDQAGVRLVLDWYRTSLTQEAENPPSVFSREITRVLYSRDPLFRPMELSDLETVDAANAAAFLAWSLNPADFTLVLAGKLPEGQTLRNLAETWLASIPSFDERRNEWIDPGVKRPGKTEHFVRKGREEKSMVYMGWFVPKAWTEEDNAAALVLNEYLDIILNDEIRETLGGVYSISAGVSHTPMPSGELLLAISFECDPGREAELREAVHNCIASLGAGNVDEDSFTKAREALVKTFERSMENNDFIARNLANFTVITGMPLSNLARRPELYRSVTQEKIIAAAKEILAGGPAEIVLLPETADN